MTYKLPIASEVILFISNKYGDRLIYNIVIIERTSIGEEPRFYYIYYSNATYFPLYYVLFFL